MQKHVVTERGCTEINAFIRACKNVLSWNVAVRPAIELEAGVTVTMQAEYIRLGELVPCLNICLLSHKHMDACTGPPPAFTR